MDQDPIAGESPATRRLQNGDQMLEIAVDLTIADQAEKVDPTAGLLGVGEGVEKSCFLEECAVPDRIRDSHQFLIHDPTGTDVLVSDL